jgi:GTP-binding protein
VDDDRRIADLPGYGFAKVPQSLKEHWKEVMEAYFQTRHSLRGVILVMDIRHPMRPFDEQMLAWCDAAGVPCHVLLTKADKLKRGPANATLLQVRKCLPPLASAQVFSARNRQGVDTLVGQLCGWFEFDADQDTATDD